MRPKAHGMQAYSVFCPLNTTEDKFRADARGESTVSLQVDDVMFKTVSGTFFHSDLHSEAASLQGDERRFAPLGCCYLRIRRRK